MYAAIFAGTSYGASTYFSTTDMSESDQEKVLNKKLRSERLATNMAAYTPAVGPAVSMRNIGPAWMFHDAAIPVSCASGLDNTSFGSNPTTVTLDRFTSMLHDVGDAEPEELLDKGRFGIPYQNTLWGDVILNSASNK